MEFVSTRTSLTELVRSLGTVKVEQLVRYFRDTKDAHNVPHYIKDGISHRVFDYDRARNEVSYRGAPTVRDDVIRRRVLAFWVIAYYGFSNVREIITLQHPSQFLFITEDNKIYDLTVCTMPVEATTAMRVLRQFALKNGEDEVNHIAILRSGDDKELTDAVLGCGFDSYCVLDEDKIPQYFTGKNEE